MLGNIIIAILGVLIFLFLFWKKLKEDYSSGQIFSAGLFILLGILLGFVLSLKFLSLWWFWLIVGGILLGLVLTILRFKFKFFETLEAVVIGLLPWFSLVFLVDSVRNSSTASFLSFCLVILLLGLFSFLDSHYRSFTWYKSGRVGFSGLTTIGVFFVLRSAVAYFFPYVLSFVGKFEVMISGIFALIIFLLTFSLAKRQL